MAAYINQSEASAYVDSIGQWPSGQAVAYLTAASAMVDQYCQRTFAAADLTADVKLAICFVADWLKNTNHVSGVITSERIGDYAATYQTSGGSMPEVAEQLLQPYRTLVMG